MELTGTPQHKGMKLTKLVATPVWRAGVPPRARAASVDAGTASQLIPGVRPLSEASVMDKNEAIQLLERELAIFRDKPYVDLVRLIPEGSLGYERSARAVRSTR